MTESVNFEQEEEQPWKKSGLGERSAKIAALLIDFAGSASKAFSKR